MRVAGIDNLALCIHFITQSNVLRQVASVLVYKTFHGNDLPVYVESLPNCIFNYLDDVCTEDVFISRVREATMKARK